MVSELEKTSLEISLKVMSSQVSTPPLIGGITYGEQVVMSDIDAKIGRCAWKSKALVKK